MKITFQDRKHELKSVFPDILDESLDLILSASTEDNMWMSTENFFIWLENLNKKTIFKIEFIDLNRMNNWYVDNGGNLRHTSGRFFSIEGISVEVQLDDEKKEWAQPIINQPEIGFLGILSQKKEGILYFLMQAKIEPGNINKIQISPTLQATKSNFSQVHGGKTPPFLDYFKNNSTTRRIITDQLQSEQGARFLKKRNRNMIIEIDEKYEIKDIPENYCWLTLGQLKKFLQIPNLINMDTRTVLSCIQL